MKKISTELFIILIISFSIWLFFFWKIGEIPHDLTYETAEYGIISSASLETVNKKIPIEEQISKLKQIIPGIQYNSEAMIYASPLINIYQMIIFQVFGTSKITLSLGTAFIGLITVILTYLLGRKMFNKWIGLISAVFLTSSLFYVTHLRANWFWHSLPPLTSLFAFYLFYLAHENRKKIYLLLSGIGFGIAIFSGYSTVFTIPLIICLFLVWSFLKKKNSVSNYYLFKIKDYLIMLIIALISLFCFDLIYSSIINCTPFKSVCWIFKQWFSHRGSSNAILLQSSINFMTKIKTILLSPLVIIKNFFIGMDEKSFSNFHVTMVKGKPMIALFPAFFILFGIAKSIKEKNIAERLLITWFGTTVVIFGILTYFAPRCLVSAAPAIYILSAKGIYDLWTTLEKYKYLANKVIRNFVLFVIGCIILLTVFVNYRNYYIIYGKKYRGNIGTYYGEDLAAKYIKANGIKNSTYIFHCSPPVEVAGCDGSSLSWLSFMFGLLEKPSIINENYSLQYQEPWMNIPNSDKLRSLEEKIFTKYKKAYFVLPYDYFFKGMPGIRTYLINTNKIVLKKLHPFILPEMVVKDDYGVPAMEIYSIDKNTPAYYSHHWLTVNNSIFKLWSPKDEYIDCMEIKGPANNATITNETTGQNIDYPLNLFPNETITITYDKNSRIVFKPHIELFNFRNYAYKNENVEYNEKDHRYIQNSSSNGYIIYKIESPDIIRELTIEGRPCLFNDVLRRNKIIYSYSIDGNTYKEIRRITSKGNLKWDGALTNDTYDTIYPYSKDIFVKFDLKGNKGQTQLWSPCAYTANGGTMNFLAYTDTSKLKNTKLLIKKGWNILKYTNKLAEPNQIILFSKTKMNSSWTIKGEYLYKDTDYNAGKRYYWYFEPGDLESGEYTFNFKIKAIKIKTKEDICIIRIGSFSKPFKELKLSGKDIVYSDFKIDFECKNTDLVTLEILFMKQANIRLDSIKIEKKK